MEAELQPPVNFPIVLINRHDLCVVIAVLSMSILGCAGVLGYSFTSYGKLKRNAVDMRHYLGSHAQMARQQSGDNGWGLAADARSNTTKSAVLALPATVLEPGRDPAPPNRAPVVARQEAINGTSTAVHTLFTNADHGNSSEESATGHGNSSEESAADQGNSSEESAAATDATSKSAETVNATLVTTPSLNTTEDTFSKVV